SYQEMVVPVDTTVTLTIRAQDVAHSWWVPKLGGKFDAIPGYTNYTWFKVPGKLAGTVFRGNCAELCGRNHANMTALVKAVTPRRTGWTSWVTTTDHKRIGIMYLVLTFVFFVLGGTEALLMRLQLSQADNTLLTPQTYNSLFTMHGTTMVFLFVVPVMAGLGN